MKNFRENFEKFCKHFEKTLIKFDKYIKIYKHVILKLFAGLLKINADIEILVLLYNPPPLFDLKIAYSYVIEVADSEYQLRFRRRPLVSEIFIFPRIRVT